MRLKRLELFGFKSFADREVLDFGSHLVGIVGPNGCGKSNVVDAVRWVLGEQRARSMRGGEMTDVIFKGSSSRPPLSVAEVTMVLDNDSGVLQGRGAEVAVTRRVYRSGEGEYLLDGERVRLKDLRELLYGTGLGSRGYSVLEQGKIDAILSANPQERRAIFEEAAGITLYRQRKKETESRLKRVEADVLRLDDVIRELERRVRSLKIQAGKAQRYVETRDGWRTEGQRLVRHQADTLDVDLRGLEEILAEAESQVAALRERRSSVDGELASKEDEQAGLSREVEQVASRVSDLGAEVRGLDERRNQLISRVQAWRDGANEEAKRVEGLEEKRNARAAEYTLLEKDIETLTAASRTADDRVVALSAKVSDLAESLGRAVREHEEQNDTCLRLLHDKTRQENHLHHLERALAPLDERMERASRRRSEAEGEAAEAREAGAQAAARAEACAENLAGLEEERAEVQGRAEGLARRQGDLESQRAALELDIARLQSRVEALLDWEEERAGLESGARSLFDAVESGEGPGLSGRLAGLLADHLHPGTESARALDAALGMRAQALVVQGEEDARAVIEWLKERSSGRVSLVLPEGLGAVSELEAPIPELLEEEGVLGTVLSIARPAPGFEELARRLLGDVVLVANTQRALDLAKRYPRLRFVTPEGDLVDAAGLSGGHSEVAQGAVGRRSFAAELETQRHEEENQLEALRRGIDELGEVRDREVERLAQLARALGQASEDRARAQSAADAARARLEELQRAFSVADVECTELVRQRAELEEERSEGARRLAALEARTLEESERLTGLERDRHAMVAERDRLAVEEGEARVEATGFTERLRAAQRQREDLRRAAEEARLELERTRRMAEEQARHADEGEAQALELLEKRDELSAERGVLEERVVALRALDTEVRAAIEAMRRNREEWTGALEREVDALGERRLERQRLELAREELGRRALEDFGLEAETLLLDFVRDPALDEAAALSELAARVKELKTVLDKLGPVNLEAVEELDEVEERLGFLSGQRADLEGARRSLEGTLAKLNEESERRFLEAFEEIRGHFQGIFRQLFGGGKADVTLLDKSNVLESGIEIMARPPGRETLPISLLSGGQRTMTALAMLFAVFESQPSPFCVLDEVDAALDDANINRFLGLLERSKGGTQYVVVTHNKGTMSACQLLYGVTMAVKGVSKVVSVELSEVDEFVPEATGGESPPSAGASDSEEGPAATADAAAEAAALAPSV